MATLTIWLGDNERLERVLLKTSGLEYQSLGLETPMDLATDLAFLSELVRPDAMAFIHRELRHRRFKKASVAQEFGDIEVHVRSDLKDRLSIDIEWK